MNNSFLRLLTLKAGAFLISSHLRSRMTNFLDKIYLGNILDELNIDVVLDVGANQGEYVRMLRNLGFKGFIFSFEPNPVDFNLLVKGFRGDPYWKGFNFALGIENGKKVFNLTEGSVCNSFLTPKKGKIMKSIEVDIKRLDSIYDSILDSIQNPRVFLKVDTQGYDLEVMKGGSGCIDRIAGLQSEISVDPIYENMPHYLDSLRYYESLGFKLMDLLVVNKRPDGRILEYDCIMRRFEGF